MQVYWGAMHLTPPAFRELPFSLFKA